MTTKTTDQGSMGYLIFASVVSALGGFLFGYDTVVISGTITQVTEQFALTPALKGMFVASALFGCMIGSAAAGFTADKYGRQRTLAISSLLMVICAFGCGFSWSASSLIFFRWLGGVGVGFASMVCPLYISEISPERLRGRLVTMFQFAITIGIFIAFLANAGWQKLADAGVNSTGAGLYHWMVEQQVWRAMFTTMAIPAVVFFALCLLIPETPRFLASIGKFGPARDILVRINGTAIAEQQMVDIRNVISQEEGRLSDLFKPGFRKALFVALFLAIVSEMSGVTVVLYYGPEIMRNANMGVAAALGGFALVGLVNMLFTVFALWLMDKAGRRPLLFVGTLGCIICLAAIGVLYLRGNPNGMAIVGLVCAFMAFFAFSIGPIKWVMMSEIFPTKIRGRAVAIATFGVWITDWVYNQVYPIITEDFLFKRYSENIGVGIVFCVFAAVLVPQLFFALFIMPETKNRTLEEIEESWLKTAGSSNDVNKTPVNKVSI